MSEKENKIDRLPHPSTSPAEVRRPVKTTEKRFLLLLLTAFLAYTLHQNWSRIDHQEIDPSPYLQGVSDKGLAYALEHKAHGHKHKHHKHDHDRHKHRHGHPISPKRAEEVFLSVPNNVSAHDTLRKLTSYPHYAGNGFDQITALALKNDWEKALGLPTSGVEEHIYDAGSAKSQERVRGKPKLGVWIDTYYPILNTPVHASVTLLTPEPFHAKLREEAVDGDPDSKFRDALPVFHGLSVSGDVTAQYVYAGYGRKRDFDALEEKGINVTGKIAIVKYGGVFRGLKIKAAQEAGAVGAIIYTDPGDDGEVTEENGYKPYPEGPARQPSSVQRGSVQFLSKYPGDPSTPNEPAYKNATRVEGGNQPSIPSLPLSYEDAIPILQALHGKGERAEDISKDWQGGLGYKGIEYWTGPSDVDLHLVNEVDTDITPIWNVAAVIPGHIQDEVVIVGNHRDAWVLGAADPNSGTAAQMETIRGIGKLVKQGWKPLRTIIFASWDAEEYGLIGSTEWAEDFGDWLSKNTAAYLNLDVAVAGSNYHAAASPSLAWLLRQAADDVSLGSDASRSVFSTLTDGGDWKAWRLEEDELTGVEEESATHISPLGSGSDYTAFLQRYGIASLDFGYKGGPKDAVYHYHSIYDSFFWQETYSDPGFHRHVEIAKVLGLSTLRLADSLVLPINTTQYAIELEYYLSKIQSIINGTSFEGKLDLNQLDKAIQTAINASRDLDKQAERAIEKLRKLLPKHPHFSWSQKIYRFFTRFGGCHGHSDKMELLSDDNHSPRSPPSFPLPTLGHVKEIKKVLEEIRVINKKKQGFEGGFISEEGIKDREWYKHKGVAPGAWLGYGATTFPALTEALTLDKSPDLAQKEADELACLIGGIAKRLSQ